MVCVKWEGSDEFQFGTKVDLDVNCWLILLFFILDYFFVKSFGNKI